MYCVSSDCCVAHPRSARVCLQFVIVVVPDHTHLMFLLKQLYSQTLAVLFNILTLGYTTTKRISCNIFISKMGIEEHICP